MDWVTLFIFALIAIGAIATAIAANEIRKLLAPSRSLPWASLIELEKRLSKGDVSRDRIKIHLEKMLRESPPTTIGDWVADLACLDILRRLGLIDLVKGQPGTPSERKGPTEKGEFSIAPLVPFPKSFINREG
ncbi:MAG: hypothetical protein K0U98_24840 [Deltaproteobacteria bacterium]|nr:hypothetical protein [Deltaproteobacteria bacterium]